MRLLDDDGNDITPPRPVGELTLIELGGRFDESEVALHVAGRDLLWQEVASALGCQPTAAWNAGDPHPTRPRSERGTLVMSSGKWILASSRDAHPPEEKLEELLRRCTDDLAAWSELGKRYEVWVSIVGWLKSGNRELSLEPEAMRALADRGVRLIVDLYVDVDEP